MLKALLPLWFVHLPFLVLAQPPVGYYDAAEGLTGEPLRLALRGIIDDHVVSSYAQLWSRFSNTDRKANNTVWDMYSDDPSGTPPYTYTYGGSDQCGNYQAEGDCFNREHSFPKSWFGGDVPPMNSDLFHLYPTDGYVNNKRGDLPFGDVGSADWTSLNGSRTGMNVSAGYSGTVFEPIDAYKGDFARSYFYMFTRYWGSTTSWTSPMIFNGDLAPWARNMLLAWHVQDPVSDKEVARNNRVFTYQQNRNPFIDEPQWAHSIWGVVAGVEELANELPDVWSFNNELHVQLPARFASGTLEVLDMAGRSISTVGLRDQRTAVVVDLPPGIYLAVVRSNGVRSAVRFAH